MSEVEAHRLLTVAEVAAHLRVPRSWIYDRTRRGAIPARRVGKYVRFDLAEVTKWVEAGCPASWKTEEGKGMSDAGHKQSQNGICLS